MKLLNTAQNPNLITLGARASKLSVKQIEEVVDAMRYYYPYLQFSCRTCQTKGDKDQQTSLRDLEKTDFFTQELDRWVLEGFCQIAVHSAKDLPDPLPQGLEILAITASKCSEDVVVFRSDDPIPGKDQKPIIATSSLRRKEEVLKQWPFAQVVDLRGNIDQRLSQLENREVDGVVIAKIALIRLGYFNLNVFVLPGETAPLQGSLAIVAQEGNTYLKELFSVIDSRKNLQILYTGLDPHAFLGAGHVVHEPLIEVCPTPFRNLQAQVESLQRASHLILTSQTAVQCLFELLKYYGLDFASLKSLKVIAVGQMTAKALQQRGGYCAYLPKNESQEGLIKLFNSLSFRAGDLIIYPKSSLARPLLFNDLQARGLEVETFDLYETVTRKLTKELDLNTFDQIVLTSSSCVKSFFENFPQFDAFEKLVCKGVVTRKALEEKMSSSFL